MKKFLFILLTSITLFACSSKVYNTQLKQVQLGMHKTEVIAIMGDKYTEYEPVNSWGNVLEKIEYKDRYKFHWLFEFKNGYLEKWYKQEDAK